MSRASNGQERPISKRPPTRLSVRPATQRSRPEFERDGQFGAGPGDRQFDRVAGSRLEREIAAQILLGRQLRPVDGEEDVTADRDPLAVAIARADTRLEDPLCGGSVGDLDHEQAARFPETVSRRNGGRRGSDGDTRVGVIVVAGLDELGDDALGQCRGNAEGDVVAAAGVDDRRDAPPSVINGPPLLPGLTAASVWIASGML